MWAHVNKGKLEIRDCNFKNEEYHTYCWNNYGATVFENIKMVNIKIVEIII